MGSGRKGGRGVEVTVPRSLSCHDDEERRPDMELGEVGEDIFCKEGVGEEACGGGGRGRGLGVCGEVMRLR